MLRVRIRVKARVRMKVLRLGLANRIRVLDEGFGVEVLDQG